MEVEDIITHIVNCLKPVRGVSAIVLGGSRARGTESPGSDIDIGIYYDPDKGLDIGQLSGVASAIDDDNRDDLVTDIGEWGPWINGGGWLQVNHFPVDFLFRDQSKVSTVIEQCRSGHLTIDYQPGHPHGFVNSIYLAEIAYCSVLWDPAGIVAALKAKTTPFPAEYQKAVIAKFMWEADFSLRNGYKAVRKRDVSYTAGCCFRAVSCLNQVLFALNETYLMNEKGAVALADSFRIVPRRYASRVQRVFETIKEESKGMKETSLDMLRDLIQETESLATTVS